MNEFPFEVEYQVVPTPVKAKFVTRKSAENFLKVLDSTPLMEAVSYNFERESDGEEEIPETFLNR